MKKINLSIPTPCHENWDAMTPNEQGRFCGACNKSVIDFTSMSDAQVINYFKQTVGSVCGRLHPDQLDRDIILPRKRLPWIKYFFQFALPAFLLGLKATAQTGTTKGRVVASCKPSMGSDTIVKSMVLGRMAPPPQLQTVIPKVSGRVVDNNGEPVAFASIFIKGTQTGVVADGRGDFVLQAQNLFEKILVASAVGFESVERKVTATTRMNIEIIKIANPVLSGEVIILGGIFAKKPIKPIPLIKQKIDTAFSRFSIYPNPSPANSTIIVNTKKLEKGVYAVSIMTTTGEIIDRSEITITQKGQLLQLLLPNATSGVYLVSLFNKKTNKIFVEKLSIQ